jgi:hypothetical protein
MVSRHVVSGGGGGTVVGCHAVSGCSFDSELCSRQLWQWRLYMAWMECTAMMVGSGSFGRDHFMLHSCACVHKGGLT